MKKFITYILILNMCFFVGTSNASYAISGAVNPATNIPNASMEQSYCKDIPPMSWSNLLNGSFLFLGGACALGSMTSFLTTAGAVAWGFSQIHSLKYCYEDVKELGIDVSAWLKSKFTSTHREPGKTIAALKKSFKEIKGQETPKSTI